jgi:hypothetical protein
LRKNQNAKKVLHSFGNFLDLEDKKEKDDLIKRRNFQQQNNILIGFIASSFNLIWMFFRDTNESRFFYSNLDYFLFVLLVNPI